MQFARCSGTLANMSSTFRVLLQTHATVMIAAVTAVVCPQAESAPIVSFAEGVLPILRAHCSECHDETTQKAELNLTTAAGVLRGSESGPIVAAADPATSRLLEVLETGEMPPDGEGEPLSPEQIEVIRHWIEQGADVGTVAAESSALNQHDVLPTLMLHCATCHGRQVQEAELDIRTVAAMLQGGKSGPAIVPHDAEASLLIQKIKAEQMPPREKLASHSVKPVSEQGLKQLVEWINLGAPVIDVQPDVATGEPDRLVIDADRNFWSFRSPQQTAVPTVKGIVRNPVDAFILNSLQAVGLSASAEASKHVLIRRAYFDLIGLPPAPEAVEAFVADDTPYAYERLIDRLLESPRYGERWGQYWLDLAGYSDSEGVQNSDPERPHAYRYRDYVIRSFNADKPYDQFLMEQIAGDELVDYENAPEITDAIYEKLVATGFLRMTSDGTFAGITGFVPNRLDVIDDQLRVLGSAVMGLTIRCARCHSHKFDPIPQRDYYRLVALLKPAMDEHDWLKPVTGGAGNSTGEYRYLPHVTTAERTRWEQQDDELTTEIAELKKRLKEKKDAADGEFVKTTEEKIKRLESQRTPEPMLRALWDRGEPSPTYLLRRGSYLQPARLIGPGVPSVLTDGKTPFAPQLPWPGAKKTGSRLALARWLTDPDHPLTARVIVNRVWKHHFGVGIVKTLDDFGRAGATPSHPELLDWLAVNFMRHGWSIKHLHRLMMTSATYRQSSQTSPDRQRADPENTRLSRMRLRRMEAEVLRDTLLAVAGQLDLTPFGPADPITANSEGLVISNLQESGRRRSLYVLKRRTQRLTILDNFDRPTMSPNCVDRPISIVAPQALFLMNNKMVHELSLALAERLIAEVDQDNQQQIDRLCLVALGRAPSSEQQQAMMGTLEQLKIKWREQLSTESAAADFEGEVTKKSLANLCHVVMNSAAFLYID